MEEKVFPQYLTTLSPYAGSLPVERKYSWLEPSKEIEKAVVRWQSKPQDLRDQTIPGHPIQITGEHRYNEGVGDWGPANTETILLL